MTVTNGFPISGAGLPDIYGFNEPEKQKRSKLNYLIDVPVLVVFFIFVTVLMVLLVPFAVIRSVSARRRVNDRRRTVLAGTAQRSIGTRQSKIYRVSAEGGRGDCRGLF
jgi:hypothetical protein